MLSRSFKMELKPQYCKDKIITKDIKQENLVPKKRSSKKLIKQNTLLYINQFNTNPFESYRIISNISQNVKVVALISSPNTFRCMTIIPGGEEFNDKGKKRSFLDRVKDLQLLDHPNICKIYEFYIYEDNYYLISNFKGDNNVLNKMKNSGTAEEPTIRLIMNQILSSIMYLHQNDIFDISLQIDDLLLLEITLKSRTKTILKLGKNSREINKNKSNNEQNKISQNPLKRKLEVKLLSVGYLKDYYDISDLNRISYYSPEIVEKIENNNILKNNIIPDNEINMHNDKKDEWSCGIIMYYLITGEFPFNGSTKEELFNKIKNEQIDFSSPKLNLVSEECKDLLSKLLEKDESKRIRAMDCFEHPFLTGELMKKESEEINVENLKNLLNIKKPKSKFHEIIISYLCFNFIDKSEEKKLSDLFKFIDKDHNNVIKERDIKGAFERNGIEYTQEQISNILNVFEYDHNSFIQYQEFLRALCDKQDLFKEENLKIVFNAIDYDKTNYINSDDIKKFVAHDEENKNIIEKEYMEPFGMKSNDKMNYEQFCEIIREDKLFSEVNDI